MRKPTTSGISIDCGWPSSDASASIPPTPQPTTPSAADHGGVRVGADDGVGEREPLAVHLFGEHDGREILDVDLVHDAGRRRHHAQALAATTDPSAGTRSAPRCARTRAREFRAAASGVPKKSTCTEWSITRSAGRSGLIRLGSPPSSAIASRITARSTTAGTPVRSWSTTRAGRKAISRVVLARTATSARAPRCRRA